MNRASVIIGLIVVAVLGLGAVGFFSAYERKEVDAYEPAHGEARYNRFFALQRTLEQLHLPVKSVTSLNPVQMPLKAGDTVVLGAGVGRIDDGDAERLAGWVSDGGHLILSPGSAEIATHTPLFDRLKLIQPKSAGFSCVRVVTGGGKDDRFELCGTRLRPRSHDGIDASIGDARDGYVFLRFQVGDGTVSLLGSLGALTNDELRGQPQQRFVRRLLDPDFGQGHVYLIYALDGPSFWMKLLTQGWPALLALSLLLVAWAVMRGERLGPMIPAPPMQRRALLEHVQAAGEFLFRRDSGYTLHDMACRTVLARVRRMDPLCMTLEGEALYERLGERYRLDPAQLARAFQTPANAMAFRDSLAILARLRSRP
jgi:hypothetical protein